MPDSITRQPFLSKCPSTNISFKSTRQLLRLQRALKNYKCFSSKNIVKKHTFKKVYIKAKSFGLNVTVTGVGCLGLRHWDPV